MAGEIQRQNSHIYNYIGGNGYDGEQQSLRRRQVSSPAPDQSYPHFNWDSTPEDEDEDSDGGPKRDIRCSPLPMHLRRTIREVQQMRSPAFSRDVSWRGRQMLRKLRNKCKEFLYFFSLWRKSVQMIGGNFGGGVQSYFVFLRFLVVLNFVSFFLIAGFVLIPSVVFRSTNHHQPTTNSTDILTVSNNLSETNCTAKCKVYEVKSTTEIYQYLLDFLSGTGFMEYSYLFYGYYNITEMPNRDFFYNIPLAYILTAVFYFAFCLICMITRMGTAARVAVATGSSTGVSSYSMIVFTGWDYSCLGDRATKLKQKNILYQLQVDLEEESRKRHKADLSTSKKVILYSLRVLMTFLSLGFIGGAFYGIYVTTQFSQNRADEQGILGFIIQYLPSMVITAGNFVVPLLCDKIALVEQYFPSTTIILALLRAVFLRLVSLGVLLYTLWSQITCYPNELKGNCTLCGYNYKEFQCWETRVGQEMYKLTMFDLLITVAVFLLVEFPRRLVVDNCSCKPVQWVGRQEFVVPSNVLGLVYGQTVVWVGALFCPLLPAINTLKFVILFYCKKITLFQNCRPALRTFRSTTSTFFFLVVLLFGWGLATVVLIYSLSEIRPSYGCGPFHSSSTMWSTVPDSFNNLSNVTQEFLFFVGSQAFSIPLFALAIVVMCYVVALATVYGRSIALLKAQLKLESRDKQFLIKQIESLSRQAHMPTHHAGVQD
nr:transmembrane channel-like protein 4 [Maylandia zebra]